MIKNSFNNLPPEVRSYAGTSLHVGTYLPAHDTYENGKRIWKWGVYDAYGAVRLGLDTEKASIDYAKGLITKGKLNMSQCTHGTSLMTPCKSCDRFFAPTPTHYLGDLPDSIQPITYIQSWNMDFLSGNIIKYITRAPYKGTELADLLKAKQYLDWLIESKG